MGFSNGITEPLRMTRPQSDWSTRNEAAALAILEKYCLASDGENLPDVAREIAELRWIEETPVKELLIEKVCPQGRYDGMGAWEIARKIVNEMRGANVA